MTVVSVQDGSCLFFHFGLIVTGKGENKHLPKLFDSLVRATSGVCRFEVIRFVGQRYPIVSDKKKLKMVGSGKTIPNKDVEEIGLPARRYVSTGACHFVIIIDDLEYDRRHVVKQVYERYRSILDTILLGEQKARSSVHFLANMLEAYYFGDANAVNMVLDATLLSVDFEGDVEEIVHPKGELKKLHKGFREIEDGGEILAVLDIERVLSRPETCAYLRTLFAWCVKALERYPYFDDLALTHRYSLTDGVLSEITRVQLDIER